MAEGEGAGGGERNCDVVLATMLQVYFETLRREPLPGRLVETLRELAASARGGSNSGAGTPEAGTARLQ